MFIFNYVIPLTAHLLIPRTMALDVLNFEFCVPVPLNGYGSLATICSIYPGLQPYLLPFKATFGILRGVTRPDLR